MNDHDHNHAHTHAHSHATGSIKLAFFLNLGFTIVEFFGGMLTNSTAILADAVHDLGDTFALGQAWYFERLAGQKSDARYSYGYQRFSIFGAFMSALLMLVSSLFILSEAIPRLFHPETPDARGMIYLALAGIAVNGAAMLRLIGQRGLNARVIGLHLLEDVLGWIAVLVVSIVLLFRDIPVLDPILAILITLYIMTGIYRNLKAMFPVFLQAVPKGISLEQLTAEIERTSHVSRVHHAHLWSLDGERTVFTAHLEIGKEVDPAEYACIKSEIRMLIEKHGIYHSTVEIEYPGEACRNVSGE